MKWITYLILLLFIIQPVYATVDFYATVTGPKKVNIYEGEPVPNAFQSTITNQGEYCDIFCDWFTSMNTNNEGNKIKVPKSSTSNSFPINVKAEGNNGVATFTLKFSCMRSKEGALCTDWWGEQETPSQTYYFNYLYNGDGICTSSRERCDNYLTFLKDSACDTCSSSNKECKPNSNRAADDKGCATFCGNKIVEKQFESCSDCQGDVGKCDNLACSSGSECEGKYCIHEVCYNKPYKNSDTFCDKNVGENCKNSGSDCACGSNERCSSSGVCETYCGNGVCEQNEQGKCKADCNWCGDGTCQEKESCDSCSVDCGACKKITKEDELARNSIKSIEEVKEERPKEIVKKAEKPKEEIKSEIPKQNIAKSSKPISKGIVGSGSTESVDVGAEGTGRLIAEGGSLKFTVNNEEHMVIVKEIGKDSVILTIKSTPFDLSLNKGDAKDVDVDGDGVEDINVKFNGVFYNKADVTLTSLTKKESRISMDSVLYLIIIAFILLVVVVGYLFYHKKKGPNLRRHLCPKCHKSLSEGDQEFCHHCGHRLRIINQVVEKKKNKGKITKKKR